jgi:hypothetical protein
MKSRRRVEKIGDGLSYGHSRSFGFGGSITGLSVIDDSRGADGDVELIAQAASGSVQMVGSFERPVLISKLRGETHPYQSAQGNESEIENSCQKQHRL